MYDASLSSGARLVGREGSTLTPAASKSFRGLTTSSSLRTFLRRDGSFRFTPVKYTPWTIST